MKQQRRHLLGLLAASAGAYCLPQRAWSQTKFTSDPFTLGVASGSPTHDSVVLWTRLLPQGFWATGLGQASAAVGWEVALDEQFVRIVQSGQTQAMPELAHSVHVEVAGLLADRWYFYRFRAGEVISATGRTRTLAARDAKAGKLRLAYASCQRWEHGYYSAYRHMRDENLDAVVFLGDYIYEYPGAAQAVRTPTGGWVTSLADYRQRYALHKSDLDLQALHAHCPWLVTWDDHEVQNDYAGVQAGNSGALDLSNPAAFAARRAAAYQAFYEHMPVRASVLTQALAGLATGAEMRIHHRVDFGALASIYLLDARQYKDPQPCGAPGKLGSATFNPATCDTWAAPDRSMLGLTQERWLDTELAKASPAWNLLGQQSLFGPRDFKVGPGRTLWNDGWDGYPAARTGLTSSLQKNAVANAVLLGGDVHENWVGHVQADYAKPQSAAVAVEFCGTSITSRSSPASPEKVQALLGENPHFIFAETQQRGYGVVELTAQKLTTTPRVVDEVTRKDARIATLAKFEVQAGRARVEQV